MPLNDKFLDKSGLTYFWSKLKDLFSGKVDKETGKGLSSNDYTTSEKTKLNGIETGANKTIVDSEMSSSSTNPVQNKIIKDALDGKQNTLTFDSAPTQSSTNPVTSGGIYTDQQRQEVEIGVVANAGAKSLLPIGVSSITYYSAVTFSVADDGQITVNGANPNTSNGIVYQDIVTAKTQQTETRYTLPVGRYKITGTGTNGLRFQVHCHDGTNTHELFSKSSSGEFSYTESLKSQYPYICWRILIVANSSFSNHVLKPMIWDASITDSTFVPYAKTNRELTVAEDEDRAALIAQVDGGAKNKLPMTHAGGSITRYGVTCTWDLNAGTMILNGTHRSGDSAAIFEFYDGSAEDATILPAGSYVITGCPTGGSTSTYRATLTQIAGAVDTGNGRSFELSEPHYAAYRVLISGNVAFNNMVFKPMVCSQEDYAISPAFVPYAPTNRELWQKINAIKRTYKVPISSTPINGIYFGVQMFPFEFDSVPEGTVAVQNTGQGGTAIDPTKFTTQINTWGFRIYTTDSAYAGLIPDVKIL